MYLSFDSVVRVVDSSGVRNYTTRAAGFELRVAELNGGKGQMEAPKGDRQGSQGTEEIR